VEASTTSLTELYGVGAIVAAHLIGYTGDVLRFPSAGHYARYNSTAPIEALSGPRKRHRLNPRGKPPAKPRHVHDHPSPRSATTPRAGPTTSASSRGQEPQAVTRALMRRISDAVHRQLVLDAVEYAGQETRRDDSSSPA
jgi:hypothetical protein